MTVDELINELHRTNAFLAEVQIETREPMSFREVLRVVRSEDELCNPVVYIVVSEPR